MFTYFGAGRLTVVARFAPGARSSAVLSWTTSRRVLEVDWSEGASEREARAALIADDGPSDDVPWPKRRERGG